MLVAESKSYELLLDLLADWLVEDLAAEVQLKASETANAAIATNDAAFCINSIPLTRDAKDTALR